MESYELFDATHRVIAFDDDRVIVCKSNLISALEEAAPEFSVGVHASEIRSLPNEVSALKVVPRESNSKTEDELMWRTGDLPDDDAALQAIHNALGDDGSLPVSILSFHAPSFEAVVTASTNHLHVGKIRLREESPTTKFVERLTNSLGGFGIVVPSHAIAAWEQDGKYVELTGSELCVFDGPVAGLDEEERMSVSHHCHDLTQLDSVRETADNELALSWRSKDTLIAQATRRIMVPHYPTS